MARRLTRLRSGSPWLVPGESSRRLGLALVGVGLFVGFSLSFDNFSGKDNVLAIALNLSSIAIASVGTMALLTSGNVDLSIGSQLALTSVVTAEVVKSTQSAVLGVLVALAVGAALGFVNGVLVRLLRISPLIVTLGMLALYRGLAFVVTSGVSVYGFPKSFTDIGLRRIAGVPLPVVVAALIFLAGSMLLLRTVTGLRLYAIGGNADASRLLGINVNRTVVGTFTFNGLLMGVVALLTTARLSSGTPEIGVEFELDVLTAVILGGVAFAGGAGHPLGVLTGVVTIGVLDSGLIFAGLQDWYQQLARGALLLAALGSDQALSALRARRERPGSPRSVSTAAADSRHRATEQRGGQRHIGDVVLAGRDMTVRYGGVVALESASVSVRAGEILCLVGDNGAGKSTLIKVLSGAVPLTHGDLLMDGRHLRLASPKDAHQKGVETVFQDLALCPNLGVAHNLVLGSEPRSRRLRWLDVRDDRAAVERARQRLASLGVRVDDLNRPVRALSGGQRQAVAIARVLRDDVRVVILDEPTAALGVAQTRQVLELVRSAAARGHAVVLITHDVHQVFEVADRVAVLRVGTIVHDGPIADLAPLELLELMTGSASDEAARRLPAGATL